MTTITKEQLKAIINAQSEDIRVLSGNMKLSFHESPHLVQTVSAKKTQIIIVGSFDNDGEDFLVAKKAMAKTLSERLGMKLSVADINALFSE